MILVLASSFKLYFIACKRSSNYLRKYCIVLADEKSSDASQLVATIGHWYAGSDLAQQSTPARCLCAGRSRDVGSRYGRCSRHLRDSVAQQHQGRPSLAAQGLRQRSQLPALRDRFDEGSRGDRLRPEHRLDVEAGQRSPSSIRAASPRSHPLNHRCLSLHTAW